jgi:hypothetical protein
MDENTTEVTKSKRGPRHNPKLVDAMRAHYASVTCKCIAEHWTCDRFITERNKLTYWAVP